MNDLSVMYSSKSDEWATPQQYFDDINQEFNFNLDPCATKNNHKCDEYYTQEDDGLRKNWGGRESFVIHPTAIYQNGYKRLFMRQGMITH